MSESHPFKHGGGNGGGAALVAEAEESAAHVRIVVRGALARQVRQEQFGAAGRASLFGKREERRHIGAGQTRRPIKAGRG